MQLFRVRAKRRHHVRRCNARVMSLYTCTACTGACLAGLPGRPACKLDARARTRTCATRVLARAAPTSTGRPADAREKARNGGMHGPVDRGQEKTKEEDCGQRADEVSIATLLKAKPFKMIHVDGIIQIENVSRNHQHESLLLYFIL